MIMSQAPIIQQSYNNIATLTNTNSFLIENFNSFTILSSCSNTTPLAQSFTANSTTSTFTTLNHGYVTGLVGQVSTTSSLPTGLSASTNYYIIVTGTSTFQLASSLANALAGINLVITSNGSGTQTFTPTSFSGGVLQPQVCNDNINWINYGTSQTITLGTQNSFSITQSIGNFLRLQYSLTSGMINATIIISASNSQTAGTSTTGSSAAIPAATGIVINTDNGLTGGPITTFGTIGLAPIGSSQLLANPFNINATPTGITISAFLDISIGSSQGYILYRNGSVWTALPPGGNGQLLSSGGTSGNPSWSTVNISNSFRVIAGTSASDTATLSDATISWQSTAGTKTSNIPGAGTANAGHIFNIVDGNSMASISSPINIVPASGTINGTSSLSITSLQASYSIQSDGISNWIII